MAREQAGCWYLIWYQIVMTALNVQFTDDEMADLRATAEREGKSLKAVAHDAVVSVVSSRKHLVAEAAARVAAISEELNARLAK
jgi:prephenate dehydrogenase